MPVIRAEHKLSENITTKQFERTFVRQLKAWRKRTGMSQNRLAKTIGVSVMAISNIEAGHNGFSSSVYVALCDQMGVSPLPNFPQE